MTPGFVIVKYSCPVWEIVSKMHSYWYYEYEGLQTKKGIYLEVLLTLTRDS